MKLTRGPEFLKYLAAHASESGKHPQTLEKLAKELDRGARLLREPLNTAYTAGFVRFDVGSTYE
ncbi:MAG: hypothetical protein E3J69_09385 [Anaerolineales bacterium]|nr:MAG: hypothetical protein E3J69_09385 [Anaerolineales bacterium]